MLKSATINYILPLLAAVLVYLGFSWGVFAVIQSAGFDQQIFSNIGLLGSALLLLEFIGLIFWARRGASGGRTWRTVVFNYALPLLAVTLVFVVFCNVVLLLNADALVAGGAIGEATATDIALGALALLFIEAVATIVWTRWRISRNSSAAVITA